jgi:hypothetical protein
MSHDIGTLRALASARNASRTAAEATNGAFVAAATRALDEAFGIPERRHPAPWVNQSRLFVRDRAQVDVVFNDARGMWHAQADIVGCMEARTFALADTPRAAVTQALAALEVTHPTEAAALAAVIPPEKS